MPDIDAIRAELQTHGQEHLLRFYDTLSPPEQAGLLRQLEDLNWAELNRLIETYVLQQPAVHIPDDIQPPTTVPHRPTDPAQRDRQARARAAGEQALADGKVAAFVVAGGQGTRLGYAGPKGCYEATPIARKPLFQVFAEQILAARRRHGAPIPWYVMTSPVNDVATRAFFRQHEYFGLPAEDVFFLTQGTMPALGPDGKLILSAPGALALSPDGHGGSLAALRKSGALDDMARRGVEYVSYFQVDNPLTRCVDPLFVGLHATEGAEMSAKCLPKRQPLEKLGNFCLVDGRVTVIEYSDLPDELAYATCPDGRLRFSAGSIAIHVFSREFIERLTDGGELALPWHRAEKRVPFVDREGRRIEPDEPNAIKLEQFVFDAMPLAERTLILETDRTEEFSPIKNARGDDSPATSLHDQVRRVAGWMEEAGIEVPRDADGEVAVALEVSPLYADSAKALIARIDPALSLNVGQSLYLGDG